jgi:hypothetical protein
VADVLFQQLQKLSKTTLRRFLIGIYNKPVTTIEWWYTSEQGDSKTRSFTMPSTEHSVAKRMTKGWKQKRMQSIQLDGVKLKDFVKYLIDHGWVYPKGERPPDSLVMNPCPFLYGNLIAVTYEPMGKIELELILRFAKVFEQTYTRFLDLQKAEEQARKAQIEAALERVRSRMMGMQNSSELEDTNKVMHE